MGFFVIIIKQMLDNLLFIFFALNVISIFLYQYVENPINNNIR